MECEKIKETICRHCERCSESKKSNLYEETRPRNKNLKVTTKVSSKDGYRKNCPYCSKINKTKEDNELICKNDKGDFNAVQTADIVNSHIESELEQFSNECASDDCNSDSNVVKKAHESDDIDVPPLNLDSNVKDNRSVDSLEDGELESDGEYDLCEGSNLCLSGNYSFSTSNHVALNSQMTTQIIQQPQPYVNQPYYPSASYAMPEYLMYNNTAVPDPNLQIMPTLNQFDRSVYYQNSCQRVNNADMYAYKDSFFQTYVDSNSQQRYLEPLYSQRQSQSMYTVTDYVPMYNADCCASAYTEYPSHYVNQPRLNSFVHVEPIQYYEQKYANQYSYTANYEVNSMQQYMMPNTVAAPAVMGQSPTAYPVLAPQFVPQPLPQPVAYQPPVIPGPLSTIDPSIPQMQPPHAQPQTTPTQKYPYIYVSENGLITALLKNDISVEMTLDRTVRLVNHTCRLVVATNGRGSSSCLYHPGVRVCQDGTNTDAEIYGERKARMTTDYIHFSLKDKIYRFNYNDISEDNKTDDAFVDISRDHSVDLLFNAENAGKDSLAMCYEATREAHCQYFPYGGFSLRINGVKVTQTDLGDVIVTSWPKYLKIATGNTYLHVETHFSDISVDKNWNVRVSRGAHVLRATPSDFILSNGRLCAGFVNENEFTVYNVTQSDKSIHEKERRWRPNCPRGIKSPRSVGKRTPREGAAATASFPETVDTHEQA